MYNLNNPDKRATREGFGKAILDIGMKNKNIIYSFLLLFILKTLCIVSQNSNIDSCINVLKTAKDDTNKVILLSCFRRYYYKKHLFFGKWLDFYLEQ